MIESHDFLKSVLDTVTEHIVVIDPEGNILFVNRSWTVFGESNGCQLDKDWQGVNYLQECDKAASMNDDFGATAAKGIRAVLNAEEELFYFEYPCHSPTEKRWFLMRVTPFSFNDKSCFVISHQNITERKIAEEKALELSLLDGLTGIPNRRSFEDFIADEWKRCQRQGLPISLALIDLDHFKLLNDTYGHQAGDECLTLVGKKLKDFSNRPGDLCARYGGEEFALLYGNTDFEQASALLGNLLTEIRSLNVPNKNSPTMPYLTASIGLATMHPDKSNAVSDLIKHADKSLYQAKENGRNQISCRLINVDLSPARKPKLSQDTS